jgi:hypothetical protein
LVELLRIPTLGVVLKLLLRMRFGVKGLILLFLQFSLLNLHLMLLLVINFLLEIHGSVLLFILYRAVLRYVLGIHIFRLVLFFLSRSIFLMETSLGLRLGMKLLLRRSGFLLGEVIELLWGRFFALVFVILVERRLIIQLLLTRFLDIGYGMHLRILVLILENVFVHLLVL